MLAFGTPGGDQQDQWQLVLLLHHLVGGLDLQAAIDAPTLHSTPFPSSFHPARGGAPATLVVERRPGQRCSMTCADAGTGRRLGPVVARSAVRGRP